MRPTPILAAVLGALLVAGCGAAPAPKPGPTRPGTADVAYAGSLLLLNERTIGPDFQRATGNGYQGRGGGSFGLAAEISSGEIHPNVFESIGLAPIQQLEPRFTRWAVQVAASPLVLAYDPHGPYASALDAIRQGRRPLADLFALLARPGFRLGRTNPATDPQGQAFVEMVHLAAGPFRLSPGRVAAILGGANANQQIFAETALDARLQAGQLDAASAFRSQAVQLHLPYIALPASIDFGDPGLARHYATARLTLPGGAQVHGVPLVIDLTVLRGADQAAAVAFVRYMLSPAGRRALAQGGYQLLPPRLLGSRASVPAALRRELAGA